MMMAPVLVIKEATGTTITTSGLLFLKPFNEFALKVK